jgi:hypothetical protein
MRLSLHVIDVFYMTFELLDLEKQKADLAVGFF